MAFVVIAVAYEPNMRTALRHNTSRALLFSPNFGGAQIGTVLLLKWLPLSESPCHAYGALFLSCRETYGCSFWVSQWYLFRNEAVALVWRPVLGFLLSIRTHLALSFASQWLTDSGQPITWRIAQRSPYETIRSPPRSLLHKICRHYKVI